MPKGAVQASSHLAEYNVSCCEMKVPDVGSFTHLWMATIFPFGDAMSFRDAVCECGIPPQAILL